MSKQRLLQRAALMIALLSVTTLAGCAGAEYQDAAPPQESKTVRDADGNEIVEEEPSKEVVQTEAGDKVAANKGAFKGRVRDDVNYSIADARVSLLGTPYFANTDDNGEFRIINVTAGRFNLRVEPPTDYLPWEGVVEISRGNTTTLSIQVVPAIDSIYKPHVHDYWYGANEFTLMDGEWDPAEGNMHNTYRRGVLDPNLNNAQPPLDERAYGWEIPIPSSDGDVANIILPGTAEIQLTVDWSSTASNLADFGLYYMSPTQGRIDMGAFAKGDTVTIPVAAEEWDNGHQTESAWSFHVRSANDVRGGDTPAYMVGPIHTQIIIIKGTEPIVEPAHRDFWGNQNLLEYDLTAKTGVLSTSAWHPYFRMPSETLIPPGTGNMLMEFSWTYTQAPAGAPFKLLWSPGDHQAGCNDANELERASPISSTTTSKTYSVDLSAFDTDPFYRINSNWQWCIFYDESFAENMYWTSAGDVEFDLHLTLTKGQQGA